MGATRVAAPRLTALGGEGRVGGGAFFSLFVPEFQRPRALVLQGGDGCFLLFSLTHVFLCSLNVRCLKIARSLILALFLSFFVFFFLVIALHFFCKWRTIAPA